jgi:hypothetical protein
MASTSGRKPPGSPGGWTTAPGDPGTPGQVDPRADPAA